MTTGNIEAQNMFARRDINTGIIYNVTNVTLQAAEGVLDALAALLKHPNVSVRADTPDSLTFAAGDDSLAIPPNMLTALNLFPRATDADLIFRQRAYAAYLVARRADKPDQRAAARDRYIPLRAQLGKRPSNSNLPAGYRNPTPPQEPKH